MFTWKNETKQRSLHSDVSLDAMITIWILHQAAKLYKTVIWKIWRIWGGLEVLTKAPTNTAVLGVKPYRLVQIYPDLGGAPAVFCHKDGSTDHVGRFLHYRVSHPMRHSFDMGLLLTKAPTNTAVLDVMPCSPVQIYSDHGGAPATKMAAQTMSVGL